MNKRSKSSLTDLWIPIFKSQYSKNTRGHSKSLLFKILESFDEKMCTNKLQTRSKLRFSINKTFALLSKIAWKSKNG